MNERIRQGNLPPSRMKITTKSGSAYTVNLTDHTWERRGADGELLPITGNSSRSLSHGQYIRVLVGKCLQIVHDQGIITTTPIVSVEPV